MDERRSNLNILVPLHPRHKPLEVLLASSITGKHCNKILSGRSVALHSHVQAGYQPGQEGGGGGGAYLKLPSQREGDVLVLLQKH